MPYAVDFTTVSTVGLESSPVAAALAGLRANEARYFKNKYDHVFTVEPAGDATTAIDWVHRILGEERDIVISSRPLEATAFQVENIRIAYVFYQSGLSVNVMYTVDAPGSGRSGSSCPKGWKSPRSSPRGSSSRGRSRSWPEPFAAPTSRLRTRHLAYVFYESGLSVNVMYTIDAPGKQGGRVQALRRDGSTRGARLAVQVRAPEVEAGRNHSRLLLRV